MADRQYLAVKFRPGDSRTFTYHWDGEPMAVGQEAKAPRKDGDGWSRVTVAAITTKPTAFETKALLGLAPSKDDEIIARANDEAEGLPHKPGLLL